jgi:hypothetical protein
MIARRRAPDVEARQFMADNVEEMVLWVRGDSYQRYCFGKPQTKVLVISDDPLVEAVEGNIVVKHEDGRFGVYDAVTFANEFEQVSK